MIFVIVVSILGFAIGIRTSDRMFGQNMISRDEMTKIGTAYVAGVLITLFALPKSRLSAWCAVFLPMAVVGIALIFLIRKRSSDFRAALSAILTLVALKMKAGRSFRQAFGEVTAESAPHLRAKLSEIASVVVFSQQKGPTLDQTDSIFGSNRFVNEVIEELVRIDRAPHAASKRLAVLRDKLRMEDDFRRRSGQILARLRAQSLIMTVLYIGLAIFIAVKFGWTANRSLFLASGALFAIGALWIWYGGRRLKWKV